MERVCPCGYSTVRRQSAWRHKQTCRFLRGQQAPAASRVDDLLLRIDALDRQMLIKDEQLRVKDDQLSEKDRQIQQLLSIAKPHAPQVNINIYGHETMMHISHDIIQALIRDPESSIPRLIALKHSVAENANLRVPNVRERFVEVWTTDIDGQARWLTSPRDRIIGEMVESTGLYLEAEADEETTHGRSWCRWHEKLQTSACEQGSLFREQISMVHKSLARRTR